MEDVKPIVFTVLGEDLLQDQIEVDEKPIFVAQDCPTQIVSQYMEKQSKKRKHKKKLKFTHIKQRHKPQSSNSLITQLPLKTVPSNIQKEVDFIDMSNFSDNEQAIVSENVLNNDNNYSDLQIENVSKAEYFNFENSNDAISITYSISEEESESVDPLQTTYNMETKEDFNPLETDIKLFIPYIRKLCENCKKVTELVTDTLSNKKCHLCKNLVTTYCCIFCLKIKSLTDMYIHIFKFHYDKVTSSNGPMKNNTACDSVCSKCGSHVENGENLKEHESTCSVLANLFCRFCIRKTRLKREMREHMINAHRHLFKMNELENILDEIVHEADAVISLLTQHSGHCTTCKKQIPLIYPIQQSSTHCYTCSTELVYYCSNLRSGCSSRPFTKLSSLQLHLRYHANKGWVKKFNKQTSLTRICHLCGYEDERSKVKDHMMKKHSDIFLCKCDLCGASLKNIKAWKRHQAKYCPVFHQKLQCGHCWFLCFTKKRLRRHLKTVHTHLYTGKRPQCEKCGITWAGLYRLRWHDSRCSGDFEIEKAKQRELWAMQGAVPLI
ncbi:zinc finger Y-chromosomal protein 1-like [Phymastichus coffea]|uniref:zinc finger Y-chromosomal protein 1-like n=1 Tax=Phymastichus coffea TaxID=108790 RepID=UPI00273CF447|nr:zinc finger Y-chromosomal protein 1-like [Phymastichus coffea]